MIRNAPKKEDESIWWRPAVLLFFQMSAWIGIPVIMGLFVGKWLDEQYGTEPWLFLSITGLAFIISVVGMVRESKRAMKQFDTEDDKHIAKEVENLVEHIKKDEHTDNT